MLSFHKTLLPRLGLVLCLLLASACKSTPTVDASVAQPASAVAVAGQHRTTLRDVERLAEKTGDNGADLLQHHLQFMAARPGPPLSEHNAVRLLIDGPQTYDAMFSAMARARDHINLEVYIFEGDEIGEDLVRLLKRKQEEGVQVNLIYDSVGSLATPKSLFDDLRAKGIRVYEYNPVNPIEGEVLNLNNRDHRKLLIVDGVVAYTGGINISSVYSQGSAGSVRFRSKTSQPSSERGWRDTQIEVRGPAVADMQKIFFDTWNQQDEANRLPVQGLQPNYFPVIPDRGDRLLRVIASSPDDAENRIYVDLLSAIQHSRRSVHLTMAYFSPDRQSIDSLCEAAGRGVNVELVLPGFSDIWLILEAGRSHYTALLKCGVRIFERHDALVHAKTAVIDGVWSTVGSMNMDMRSFLHNTEINVIVLGKGFGADMEEMFRQDAAKAQLITLEGWRQRSISQRFKQWFARAWAYWL